MLRRISRIVPALVLFLFAFGSTALAAGPKLNRGQKSAATKAYAKRAKQQFPSATGVKVKYGGPTGRDASIQVLGVGGMTGQQQDALIGIGTGRVTVHRTPKAGRKVGTSVTGGRFQTVFSLAPPGSPVQ